MVNYHKIFFYIINWFVKIVIILGCFNLYIVSDNFNFIKIMLFFVLGVIISLGILLLYTIILAFSWLENMLALASLIILIFFIMIDLIIMVCLLIFITNICKKDKIERLLSIIYFPVLYYMIISGVESINSFIN